MSAKAQDLVAYPIAQEVFVLLNSKLSPKFEGKLPTITIESSSATWPAIESAVRENSYLSKTEFIRVESFQAAYQMATAGFGNALLPLGLMKTLRVKKSCYKVLPKIQREISLITRKTISQQESFQEFLLTLKKELEHSVHV
jgi:DNA-binding transcriptional LysR family regulator